MLDVLHPVIHVQDDSGEEHKKFPLIDILAVAEFLESGLTNKGLGNFLKDAEDTSAFDSDIKDSSSRTRLLGTTTDEDIDALGYRSAPSYPVLFSFSEELQAVVGDASRKATGQNQAALPQTVSASLPTQPVEHRKDTNPFAGPAIAAALAGRGFGHLPSEEPMSLNAQLPSKGDVPSRTGGTRAPPPTKKPQPQLTMEAHLKLMTRQCQAIFEKPEEAVTKSMKVVHTLRLLTSELTPRSSRDTMNESTEVANDVNDELAKHQKLATRYCYHVR